MKILLIASILLPWCVLGEDSAVSDQDEARRKIIERLSKIQTVVLEDYDLIMRISATAVFRYRSYRNVAVLFYPIPTDVVDARFTFQAENVHLNTIGSCDPVEVIIHLKFGSYPVVNPDGYPFPKGYVDADSREHISLEIESDGANRSYSVQNPKAGEWFGIAYLQWEDPRTQKVEQQGLFADCQTVLYTDLQVKRDNIQLIDCYSQLHANVTDAPATYKCITTDDTSRLTVKVKVDNVDSESNRASIKIQALALPSDDQNIVHCYFNLNADELLSISFQPHPTAWHYIVIDTMSDNVTDVAECESYSEPIDTDEIKSHSVIDLMRDNKGIFFSYDYNIPTNDLQETLSVVNLTSDEITTLRFHVNPILDIGGTMTLAASMLMSLKYYMGFKRPFRSEDDTLLLFSESDPFFKVVVCLDIGHHSIPTESGLCKYNDASKPALFVLNSTDSTTIDDSIMIPYPEGGTWYLSARLFCDSVVCPCLLSSDNSTKYYVESNRSKAEDYARSVRDEGGSRAGEMSCNATMMFSVSSMPCSLGRCSGHGGCVFTTSGGLVMSSCSCTTGYGGTCCSAGYGVACWDCSDDSRMDSYGQMMLSILLLTLSNMLFFFSIYVAIIRKYYVEAVMYTFTMVLSTFYHACDAPSSVAYCIVSGSILQFGDFYCGIMSFWVTLLTMSIINRCLRSVLQLTGAIIIAFLTTWNMQSLVAFMLPVTVGVAIVFSSWILDYRKTKALHFPRSYYLRYLPIGVVLVAIGLVCFAFLQTEQNYKIVHSFWHMIIALSVVCLLPDSRVENGEYGNPFLPATKFWKVLRQP